jgi:hypothetical protein
MRASEVKSTADLLHERDETALQGCVARAEFFIPPLRRLREIFQLNQSFARRFGSDGCAGLCCWNVLHMAVRHKVYGLVAGRSWQARVGSSGWEEGDFSASCRRSNGGGGRRARHQKVDKEAAEEPVLAAIYGQQDLSQSCHH